MMLIHRIFDFFGNVHRKQFHVIQWKDSGHALVFAFQPIIVDPSLDQKCIAFLERKFSERNESCCKREKRPIRVDLPMGLSIEIMQSKGFVNGLSILRGFVMSWPWRVRTVDASRSTNDYSRENSTVFIFFACLESIRPWSQLFIIEETHLFNGWLRSLVLFFYKKEQFVNWQKFLVCICWKVADEWHSCRSVR